MHCFKLKAVDKIDDLFFFTCSLISRVSPVSSLCHSLYIAEQVDGSHAVVIG